MPFLLSYNFIIQFVETFDPVKTFDLLDCDEVIQRVESTVDEFLFWSARTYVAIHTRPRLTDALQIGATL
jgi:hypothetical protein